MKFVEKVNSLHESGAKKYGSIMKEFANLPADRGLVNRLVSELLK